MTPLPDRVSDLNPFQVSIYLANDLTTTANRKGKGTVSWNEERRKRKVGFPETLLSGLLNYSLLPAFTLVRKALLSSSPLGVKY